MIRTRTCALLLTAFATTFAATISTIPAAKARGMLHAGGRGAGGTVVAGPNGVAGRAHGTRNNADGSVTHASGGAFAGANGSRGARASQTTVNPDGSLSREGGLAASGARGSVASQGSMSRSAEGSWNGNRSTQATNNQTGNSYSGSTTVTDGQVSHSGTCTNAAGAAIPCR